MTFILSGEATPHHRKMYTTQSINQLPLCPISSTSTMKSLIQQQALREKHIHGTLDDTCLQKQLQKELKKASVMSAICSQMETNIKQHSNSPKKKHKRKRPRKHKRRHYSSSSSKSSNSTTSFNSDSSD
ncbi:MAG: protein of unknown function DUF755 [Anelloviridae sp.]|nr:MAG: protein of unknown function DUF755 [Anelloviridae sp.]